MTSRSPAHGRALALLRGWEAPLPFQERRRREYVEHLLTCPDGLERECRPDHLTASTLVMSPDGQQVLLTLHAKARAWFQFGGHVEPGDHDLPAAALREALEESGLPALEIDPSPVQLDVHEVPFCGGPGTRHLDVRFLALAASSASPAVSMESADVRWWPSDALPNDEESLEELVRLSRLRLVGR